MSRKSVKIKRVKDRELESIVGGGYYNNVRNLASDKIMPANSQAANALLHSAAAGSPNFPLFTYYP